MTPGSNLLGQALRLIRGQDFQYLKFRDREDNGIGQDISKFNPPVNISGSAQPIARELYQKFGLDFQSNYVLFYVAAGLIDVKRDVSGDQILFNCRTYQCVSETNWFPMDGWIAMLAVEIKDSCT